MDMEAEIIVDTSLPFYFGGQHMIIPVRSVSTGNFQDGTMENKAWVSINGTEVWGLNQGVEKEPDHYMEPKKKPRKCLNPTCEELALENSNYCRLGHIKVK
jgi:hypothetical protein